ncbi:MAG: hypothetical protein ABR604_02090 [Jatrophihabitantaceae bacterium]
MPRRIRATLGATTVVDTVPALYAWEGRNVDCRRRGRRPCAYAVPTRQPLPIAGVIAFYNEKVDIIVDGELGPPPVPHFFA